MVGPFAAARANPALNGRNHPCRVRRADALRNVAGWTTLLPHFVEAIDQEDP
jgi:hypothetical protein